MSLIEKWRDILDGFYMPITGLRRVPMIVELEADLRKVIDERIAVCEKWMADRVVQKWKENYLCWEAERDGLVLLKQKIFGETFEKSFIKRRRQNGE